MKDKTSNSIYDPVATLFNLCPYYLRKVFTGIGNLHMTDIDLKHRTIEQRQNINKYKTYVYKIIGNLMPVTNNFQICILIVGKIHLAWEINVFLKDILYFLHFTCEPISHKKIIFTINA